MQFLFKTRMEPLEQDMFLCETHPVYFIFPHNNTMGINMFHRISTVLLSTVVFNNAVQMQILITFIRHLALEVFSAVWGLRHTSVSSHTKLCVWDAFSVEKNWHIHGMLTAFSLTFMTLRVGIRYLYCLRHAVICIDLYPKCNSY